MVPAMHLARTSRRAPARAAVLALGLTLSWLPAGTAGAAPGPTVVVSGLDNPRGLVLGKKGQLFVGEAGHAGPTCTAVQGETGPLCIGFTSRISSVALKSGKRTTVVDGLPSLGSAVGSTGVDGVSYNDGVVSGIVTFSPQGVPPDVCVGAPEPACSKAVKKARRNLGDLIQPRKDDVTTVAEVGRYNYDYIVANKTRLDPANPDFRPGDSNPYGITAGPKDGWYVVDAGSNTLNLVTRKGKVTVLAYLPNPPGPADRFPYDSVPTCVATAGHAVWVGTLAGQVFRWDGHAMTQVADRSDGLTAINGCGTDKAGNLYVSNIFGLTPDTFFAPHTGFLNKVTPGGTVTLVKGSKGLSYPAGVVVDRDGSLLVAVQSICPKKLSLVGPKDPPVCDAPGQVVRLTP
jgi:hypothetical protein